MSETPFTEYDDFDADAWVVVDWRGHYALGPYGSRQAAETRQEEEGLMANHQIVPIWFD